MPRIEATAIVEAPIEVAFALSQTYGELRYRWDPFVHRQHLLDGATSAAKGVRTWTQSRHRLVMVSEYVSFKPPTQVGMRMVEGSPFFGAFSGGWSFKPIGPHRTEATWRYSFSIRPSWLAPVADPIGRVVLGRDIRKRLDAFARACADPTFRDAVAPPETAPGHRSTRR